jgi:hypothetical protein
VTAVLPTVLAALLAAAAPMKLAAPELDRMNVDEREASYLLEVFTERLSTPQLKVTTATEIAAVLGLERQKALLGCNDASTSCMIELANALGVDGILKGSIGKFGERY